jgi:hypothetical protein
MGTSYNCSIYHGLMRKAHKVGSMPQHAAFDGFWRFTAHLAMVNP